ncbi:alpha/beta hydrolase family protein [Streptomyces synnematoformans]|uniref:Alpha/beta fold hydrolase n=1 Tax=Streptomyces synnematoformans TaxID=415721 RepID=A0ABP5JRR6_9ACTN
MSATSEASSDRRDPAPRPSPAVPPPAPPSHTAWLRAADRVPIAAAYEPGPGPGGPAVVVAHGFTGALERPAIRRAAAVFAQRAGVVTFSFRGHGGSGGRSTVGDREVLDLAAAVAWARSLGHGRVATVGFSMGGSVVLRHGALYRGPAHGDGRGRGGRKGAGAAAGAYADAVVSVSSPARWYYRGTAPMRRLHWIVERRAGRAVSRLALHTRVHHRRWNPEPLSPTAAVPLIAPVPLLVVHGTRDGYFPLDHPRALAAAAAAPGGAELWLEEGFGHAENAAGDELLRRIAAWVAEAVSGRSS